MQGVKINDKHYEVIIRQMMRKVEIDDPGDTRFLEKQIVDKHEFLHENDWIYNKKVVVDAGDSDSLKPGMIITSRRLRDENSNLRRRDKKLVEANRCSSGNIKPRSSRELPVLHFKHAAGYLPHRSRKLQKF